ncbi:polysaccharide deacetylase family protein [Ectobacillus polymachus]|uniref:polysaccharide deacetylase family protein n=1 Tax=Ectobacillus polymachus TaxID=1508806 RepID=UPI003A8A6FC8
MHVEAKKIKRSEVESQGDIVWEVPTSHKVIALTFDDGPNPIFTPQILNILKQYHVHATFFVVGNRMKENPEIMDRIVAEGHEIGNHTMTHCYSTRSSIEHMKQEILETQTYIEKWKPNSALLFRPPGGYMSEELLDLTKQEGYKTILWSWHQDTRDWSSPGVNAIANHVLKNARNGDIVLMHDGLYNKSQTIRALKIILPSLIQKGYEFVTVSELLEYKDKK